MEISTGRQSTAMDKMLVTFTMRIKNGDKWTTKSVARGFTVTLNGRNPEEIRNYIVECLKRYG